MNNLPALTLVLLLTQTPAQEPQPAPPAAVPGQEVKPDKGDERLARWWADLGSDDDVVSATAVSKLVSAAQETVPYLRQRLAGRGSTEKERRVAGLIADLDNDDFEIRDRATRELQAVREEALVQLQSALRETRAPEVRARLRLILGNRAVAEGVKSVEQRRLEGVIRVLELVATAEAREMLTTMARTDPDVGLRGEAKLALQRLERKGRP
jgi:hypothetical protein